MYSPRRKLHEEKQIVGGQSFLRPNPDRREIYRGKYIPVCIEEILPAGLSLSICGRAIPWVLRMLATAVSEITQPRFPTAP